MKQRPKKRKKGNPQGKSVAVQWDPDVPFEVPVPKNEPERLGELYDLEILDTPPEEVFDKLTLLASHICQTPIALITLIDSERQWFKSRVGVSLSETSRDIAFCAHTIMEEQLLVVPDATKDRRFAANPLVREPPRIRFYAGAPLVTRQHRALGSLCVLDRIPRKLTRQQLDALRALSDEVMAHIESRNQIKQLQRRLTQQRQEYTSISRQLTQANARKRNFEESLRRLRHQARANGKAILNLADQALSGYPAPPARRALLSIRCFGQALMERSL